MKVLINATALDSRGAFSVVKSFLYEMNCGLDYLKDRGINLHFLVANQDLCCFSNDVVNVEFEPLPKKSIYHKWKYERIILPKLIRQNHYDAYLSLQNHVLKNIGIKQFALIHQPIPFADLRFNELEVKNRIKYKFVLNKILFYQKKDLNGVIVQTNWLKEAIREKYKYECPIKVIRPSVQDIIKNTKPLSNSIQAHLLQEGLKIFYPTNREKYKNNARLIKAVTRYNKLYEEKIILYITIEGNCSKYIKYIGRVPYESIYTFYKNINALIFPSLAETLGLPLLEARTNGIPVIVSDLPYAREICKDSAYYFNPRIIQSIINAIHSFTKNGLETNLSGKIFNKSSYMDYINFIEQTCSDQQVLALGLKN